MTDENQRVTAAQRAKEQLVVILADHAEQPIVHFCEALIGWVFTGKGKPLAEPSALARQAAKQAVEYALKETYRDGRTPDNDIRTRLFTL